MNAQYLCLRIGLTLSLGLLGACQDAPTPLAAPSQPIIQNNQIRYPADHPQLTLLGTEAVAPAHNLRIELPAKLVWNEERTQRIYPAFSGRVVGIHVDLGQSVQVGSRLAQLASPEFGLAQADAARAQADLSLAQKQLRRQQELFDAGVLAHKDLELAQAEEARAQAEWSRAHSRVRLYSSATGLGVDQSLSLTSGIHGVVVERNINPGQELRPDQSGPGTPPLFVITDPQQLWVQIDARELDLTSLKPGRDIRIKVPSLPEASFTAQIHAVADYIDPSTRTIKVRAVVPNPQRLLKGEMLATAHFDRTFIDTVLVPASAVFLRGAQHLVFVQSAPGVFEPRSIVVLHESPKEVLVSEGLHVGERVVVQNGLLLARELRNAQDEAQQKPMTPSAGKP
ncbi:MAG: efflux RND transporter periplasmic adaptor subunit [Alphaproteobacteria bacterium]|nr:efflux RND transporter periplasmic adaptor subunit [Alphaproteobacteria bacterium]